MRVRLIKTKTKLKRKTWGWKEGELERAEKVLTPVSFMSTHFQGHQGEISPALSEELQNLSQFIP